MITPRATRLIRAAGAQAFREAVVALAGDGSPLDARDRLVVVPTRAAAAHLLRSLEDAPAAAAARLLPDIVTAADIPFRLAERLPPGRPLLTPAEREVLLAVACRTVRAAGIEPPFQMRPALVAEILAWYDELRRHRHDVDSFERLALAALEPGAVEDRGAERLVRQTRFLVASFREFERRMADAGADEHALRQAVMATAAERPIRHVVLTVSDRSVDPHGLRPADWDLLTRVPGLERLDVVVTDGRLAGPLHERLHRMLPGIDEVRFVADPAAARLPCLHAASADAAVFVARDREEEVATFARRVKHLIRCGDASALDRIALVVDQPQPYVLVARTVLHSAGIPCGLSEPQPLAAEPYAAALDAVLTAVATGCGRASVVELLRSPHFRFETPDGKRLEPHDVPPPGDWLAVARGAADDEADVSAADAAPETPSAAPLQEDAAAPAQALRRLVADLRRLAAPAPPADHLATLLDFMARHELIPPADDPWQERHQRARRTILGTLAALRDAYARFDATPVGADDIAALLRRWIDGQTVAPPAGDAGVHLIDAASAPFGQFEHVHLAGLVDGEWPQRQRRSIFYSAAILRDLGWPADALRLDGARAAFADLLTLASRSVALSAFLLEDDALVTASPLVEAIDRCGLERVERPIPGVRIFDDEALALETTAVPAHGAAGTWAAFRRQAPALTNEPRGAVTAEAPRAWSLSALERYQDCPFRFFAATVLRLPEPPEDEDALSPRERGRFVHEVMQRFFEAWDAQTGRAPIDIDRLDEARAVWSRVAEPLLARLGDADAALERARLFGSAISVGIVDIALAVEAAAPGEVRERWLEHEFEGAFTLGSADRSVRLKGIVDRVDLLAGNRLRIIDYKTGQAPNPRRALQAAVYALCVQETLAARDGREWPIDAAAYVSFSGRRPFVPVAAGEGAAAAAALDAARDRVFAVIDAIARADFSPRPHDPLLCRTCAYPSVCRKDYVDG